jgi:NAD(P)-dependent dehydrogenase (short-subunit alcohol dehydrogenase family)
MDPLTDLTGKTALVTGGARGIGSVTAVMLAEHGADIVVADLKETDDGRETLQKIIDTGRRGLFIPTDVSNAESVRAMYQAAQKQFGQVDILVNNAGIALTNTMVNISEADWDAVIDVNLKGVFNTCKLVTPDMVKRGWGRVINISSIAGRRGSIFGDVHYSSAKAGVIGFTKCLAKICGPGNVTVNAVAPGIVKTQILSQDHESVSQSMIPLGRTGSPKEIASVILFFACGMSDYVTGTVLDVNGGSYM